MFNFSNQNYLPLNKIVLNSKSFFYNYQKLSKKISIFPVLKSNAYGHGILEIYNIVKKVHNSIICVDSIHEANILKKGRCKNEILIMGFVNPKNLKNNRHSYTYAIWDISILRQIKSYQKNAQFHLFVDTGMNREGLKLNEIDKFLSKLTDEEKYSIKGLMSHFASSDVQSELNTKQLFAFKRAYDKCINNNLSLKFCHISASYGIINNLSHNLEFINSARPGIALLGMGDPNLKPVLEFYSSVVQIKEVQKGESIGYSETFIAPKNLKIAILPLGYNDGIDRRFSNEGVVKLHDQYCQILGRVSMNITVIDISHIKEVKLLDLVQIISSNREDKNSVENLSKMIGTIPYELFTKLNPTIKREILL